MTQNEKSGKQKGIVTATTLNLRSDPSTAKRPIGHLKRGEKVAIVKPVGGWYLIETEGRQAYVHGDYLLAVSDTPRIGFLREREDLCRIPLEPVKQELISLPSTAKSTEKKLGKAWNSQGGLLQILGDILTLDTAAAVAVICVESGGEPFSADGKMIIRFENHIFWRKWGKDHPELFHAHFRFDPQKAWQKHGFRPDLRGSWLSFHGNQKREWEAFEFARTLHESAAIQSISMGAPQIMGFNHARIGYESAREMFDAFQDDVRYQLVGLFDFFKGPQATSPIIEALKRKQWEQFASYYNGPGQASRYGELIASHYETFRGLKGG